jgi:hypothetical protein
MKKSTDSSSGDSSDDRNEAIVEEVFKNYSTQGNMSRSQFSLVIAKLTKHVPELKGVEMKTAEIAFNLFSDGGRYMTIRDFKRWWATSDKFSYFVGKKSKDLSTAYSLYRKYSSIDTIRSSQEEIKARRMSVESFIKLLSDLKIEDEDEKDEFDRIDEDGDGSLSFKEFCAWLKWF